MVKFEEHFWGDKYNGFEVLQHNFKLGLNTGKEFAEFLKERSSIEETYSKSLLKLANKCAAANSHVGTFEPCWKFLQSSTEKLANVHSQIIQNLNDVSKSVRDYGELQREKQKQMKDDFNSTTEAVLNLQQFSSALIKARESYLQRSQEVEKCRKDLTNLKDIKHAELKYKKSTDDYKQLVDKRENARVDFCEKITDISVKLQAVEEEHLTTMLEILGKYGETLKTEQFLLDQIIDEFGRNMLALTVENLLQQFINLKQTGKGCPLAVDFEESNLSSKPVDLDAMAQQLKEEKKKRKTEKRKKKEESRKKKGKTAANGQIEEGVEEGPEKNEEVQVDADGYVIRPQDTDSINSGKLSKDSFTSSEDSDDSDTERGKITVRIKPVEETTSKGSDPDLSVEELNKFKSLTLMSPSAVHEKAKAHMEDKKLWGSDCTLNKKSKSNIDLLNLDRNSDTASIHSLPVNSSFPTLNTTSEITTSGSQQFGESSTSSPLASPPNGSNLSGGSGSLSPSTSFDNKSAKSSIEKLSTDELDIPPPLPVKYNSTAPRGSLTNYNTSSIEDADSSENSLVDISMPSPVKSTCNSDESTEVEGMGFGIPAQPLEPEKMAGETLVPEKLVPERTGGTGIPQKLAPEKTGGSGIPQPLVPERTGGSGVPQPLVPERTGGSGVPQPLVPERTGGSGVPQPLVPERTGGREVPQKLVAERTGGSGVPQPLVPERTGGSGVPQKLVAERTGGSGVPQKLVAERTGGSGVPQKLVAERTGGSGAPQKLVAERTGGSGVPQKLVAERTGGTGFPQKLVPERTGGKSVDISDKLVTEKSVPEKLQVSIPDKLGSSVQRPPIFPSLEGLTLEPLKPPPVERRSTTGTLPPPSKTVVPRRKPGQGAFGTSASTLPPPQVAPPSSNTSPSFFTDLLDINFAPPTTADTSAPTSAATASTLTTCTSPSSSSSSTTSPRTMENDDSSSTETELPSDTIAATPGEPPPSSTSGIPLGSRISITSPPPLSLVSRTTPASSSPTDSPSETDTSSTSTSKTIETVKASWVDPELFSDTPAKTAEDGSVSATAWVNPGESAGSMSSAWGELPSSTDFPPSAASVGSMSPSPRPSPVSSSDGRTIKEVREELLSVQEPPPPIVPRRQVSTSKTGGNVTAATIVNLAPVDRAIPIAVAFIEVVNSVFKGSDEKSTVTKVIGDMTISFPANVVPALSGTASPQAPPLSFLVSGTTSLEQIFPNKQLVERSGQLPGGEGMLFKFNMVALAAYLKKQTEQGTKAAYYNIDILKYQVRCEGHSTAPLQLSSYWRCDPKQTDLIIEYTYNSSCMATPVPLTNVSVVAPVDGGVEIMQSKPSAIWSGEQQRCTWKIASISSNAENPGSSALRARFDVSRGPTTPVPIAVKFTGEGSTISSLNFDLTSPSYKLSLVKKRFISGRYLVETS